MGVCQHLFQYDGRGCISCGARRRCVARNRDPHFRGSRGRLVGLASTKSAPRPRVFKFDELESIGCSAETAAPKLTLTMVGGKLFPVTWIATEQYEQAKIHRNTRRIASDNEDEGARRTKRTCGTRRDITR